ncbi:MAG: hydantoinase B/oxoprolinase family protein [Alphaproteobacteria bacterium]|nr:hydantoinase B/oxoprolinase family protein [Alphaproteobacteria bacterium]
MFTMVVLRRRFEAVIREMVNALFRSGRSGVLNTAMDFSCCITDHRHQAISTALGLPIHVAAIDLISRAVETKFGAEIHPGDCFANNSGYHGNTHCADFTLCAPIFVQGELAFYAIARAHLGDMGFPIPSTYSPLARDLYEEGLMLPCVRIQRGHRDVPEVLDICKANIRAPEQFHGDYLATLAAVRTGERGIQSLCENYGLGTVRAFLTQFQTYAEDMAIAAIRKLPKGKVSREQWHDSEFPGMPDGIPVRATMEVDPEAALITIDLLDNIDNLPLGINLTEATVTAACRVAVLTVLGPDVPRATGAFRRIKLKLREGSAIGLPRFPAATSAATTGLCHVLNPMIQSMFADLGDNLGAASSTIGNPASCPCVSGYDSRHGGRPFANQIIMGYWGGPAVPGHDGWLTFGGPGAQGMMWQASVEVTEQQQPILVERLELGVDSGGAGQWEGAPGAYCVFRARDRVRFTTNASAHDFPPFGAAGGGAGGASHAWHVNHNGARVELANTIDLTLTPGEALASQACGGGGYGDPLRRDAEAVAHRAREGWISLARARDVYGVVLDTAAERYHVDRATTEALRRTLRAARNSA